jgi:hypothetical protein
MQILADHPVSIGKVLDTSIKLFAASFKKQMGFMGVLIGVYVLLGVGVALLVAQIQTAGAANPAAVSTAVILMGALFFLISIFTLVLYAGIIYRLDNLVHGREDTLMECVAFGFKKFPSMLLAAFLYGLAVLLGFVLLLIPGIILTESLMYYMFFIVLESKGAYRALRCSHSLVWGNWWRTLAIITPPMILWMAFLFGIAFLSAFLIGAEHAAGISGPKIWAQLLNNIASVFLGPYFITLGYVQYHDLSLRKSGADLESRLAG